MKTHYKPSLSACLAFALRRLALCLVLLSTISFSLSTFGQSTAFTYSGRLNDGGYPANGSYDLRFALFDAATSGTQQGSSRTNFTTGVTNGLVTVTLDFGATVFNGGDRWLELGVRTNGATVFTTLTPRQQLLRTPYAITAQNVVSNGLASGIYGNAVTFNNAANNFSGDFAGDGANVSNVNATSLGGLAASSFWNTAGNAGTTAGAQFLGTTDFQPLEFKVNGTRALRLIPNLYGGPSVVGGAPVNIIYPGTTGSTISGGGASDLHGASYTNSVFSDFGTIGGGFANTIQNSANDSTIGGGFANTIPSLGGGGTIGGGQGNICAGLGATVPGGQSNSAAGVFSLAAGQQAHALHQGSFVWADSQAGPFASSGTDTFNIRAHGGVQLSPDTSLFFGNSTRQMLDLWGTQYGIGVQSYTLYFRTDNAAPGGGFAWFQGGTHSNSQNDPGGGTELMALTGIGLGISTNSPQQLLQLNVTAGHGEGMEIDSAIAGHSPALYLNHTGTLGHKFRIASYGDNSTPGSFRIRDETLAADRMIIDADGFVGIGTPSPDAYLTVNGPADKPGGGSWGTFSDGRLKDVGHNFTNGLEALEDIQPVHYHYKTDNPLNLPAQPEYVGVVAQQVQRAVPEAVERSRNGYLVVNNDPILWTLVNAVKSLNRKLEVENAQLKQQNDSLEKRLDALEQKLLEQQHN